MAVGAGGQTFDDLLRRLAQVKPLPAAPASPSGLPSKNVTSRVSLNDSVANSFANVSPLQYQRIRSYRCSWIPRSHPRGIYHWYKPHPPRRIAEPHGGTVCWGRHLTIDGSPL